MPRARIIPTILVLIALLLVSGPVHGQELRVLGRRGWAGHQDYVTPHGIAAEGLFEVRQVALLSVAYAAGWHKATRTAMTCATTQDFLCEDPIQERVTTTASVHSVDISGSAVAFERGLTRVSVGLGGSMEYIRERRNGRSSGRQSRADSNAGAAMLFRVELLQGVSTLPFEVVAQFNVRIGATLPCPTDVYTAHCGSTHLKESRLGLSYTWQHR